MGYPPNAEQQEAKRRIDRANGIIIDRPCTPILESGLAFDHFVAPFQVSPPTGPYIGGFISVGDALDFAIRKFHRTGEAQWVLDSTGEMVYVVE